MEIISEIIPIGALTLFYIMGLVAANKEISKRPTFREIEDKYTEAKVCKAIHTAVDEKLECLPEIKKTVAQIEVKIDMLLHKGDGK